MSQWVLSKWSSSDQWLRYWTMNHSARSFNLSSLSSLQQSNWLMASGSWLLFVFHECNCKFWPFATALVSSFSWSFLLLPLSSSSLPPLLLTIDRRWSELKFYLLQLLNRGLFSLSLNRSRIWLWIFMWKFSITYFIIRPSNYWFIFLSSKL